jgi:hypothetical protein
MQVIFSSFFKSFHIHLQFCAKTYFHSPYILNTFEHIFDWVEANSVSFL